MADFGLILIPILIGIVLQSGALFYWGGKIAKSVSIMERLVSKHDDRIRALEMGFDND